MSANSQTPGVSPTAKTSYNVVTVRGRVDAVDRYKGEYSSILICPAADEFSHPQAIKVRSKNRIGTKDEIITVTARLGGYKRQAYQTKPDKDGEVFTVIPVDMTLDLVE